MLVESCPSFETAYELSNDKELHYAIAGNFARHLLDLYQTNKINEFEAIAQMIENLHLYGDHFVKEYATTGILESIQNIWGNSNVDPENFARFLQPVSLKFWNSLNRFWNGEIPLVGTDVD